MKTSSFLSLALGSLLLASCSKDHKNEQSSDRKDNSTSVSGDSSVNRRTQSDPYGAPTYDPGSSSSQGNSSSKEDPTYNSDGSNANQKTRVDHSTRDFNGRSKNDSTEMNSGVAGQQGAGSGVGNGGSINAAEDSKRIK